MSHCTARIADVGLVMLLPVLLVAALGLAACASTGESTSPAGAAAPAEVQEDATAEAPAIPESAETATAGSPVAAHLADPEAVALGRRYFRAVCTGYCHTTRAGLSRDAPNLFDCAWSHGGSDEEIFQVIAAGVPDTEMLPFGDKLEDEILWKIIAYLRADSRCEDG